MLSIMVPAIKSRDLVLDAEWRTRGERSLQKRIQRSAEHGKAAERKSDFQWLFIRIGEAERAWQLYRLTSITRTNQSLWSSQGQRSENRPQELGAADRWNVLRVPMWIAARVRNQALVENSQPMPEQGRSRAGISI